MSVLRRIVAFLDLAAQDDCARDRDTGKALSPEAAPKRTLGSLRGLLEVPENFDDPLPDELQRVFEGEVGG
jgi:hypothetical protein